MKTYLPVVWLLIAHSAFSQSQVCPLNIDWSFGNFTHWQAYTGNNATGNGLSAIKVIYDSTVASPSGALGNTVIYEYQLPDTPAIQVISSVSRDKFGSFPTIPSINGYQYTYSIKIGSTSTDAGKPATDSGGYVRGLGYRFEIPPGPETEPYTLTYAYALVMNNGYHPNNEQPLFSVTLMAGDSVVNCASPRHYLPTNPDGTLDTPNAKLQGFYLSDIGGGLIWAKGWTEVSIDLATYRGQMVSLTFETDNCVPGGHFAYSYVAMRNNCAMGIAAPVIAGDSVVCPNTILQYGVPYTENTTYQWLPPPGWSVEGPPGGDDVNLLSGANSGTVVLNEQYGCLNLQSMLKVATIPPSIAGAVSGGTEVCTGTNAVTLTSAGNQGSIVAWLATTDGISYTTLNDTTLQYPARNLSATTTFRTVVQNGPTCAADTSSGSTIVVDPLSVGGELSPTDLQFCEDQDKNALLQLIGQTGNPVNWQTSADAISWAGVTPADTTTVYNIGNLTALAFYRVIVQSGVCPVDTSTMVEVNYVGVPFPRAAIDPSDTLICYGASAALDAVISIGTNYTWTNAGTLANQGSGIVNGLPDVLQPVATPGKTTDYVLSIGNAGCPNLLLDTFQVRVLPPIVVNAGDDTSVVIGEPLQLRAISNDTATPGGDVFLWAPATGLSNATIFNPVATYPVTDSIRLQVMATAANGCTGIASILIKVFGTGAGLFVPGAFTPGAVANSIFRPVAVGISNLAYFRVYNRWGQLVYSTTALGAGWDGRINGHLAESGAYVWMVRGTAYTGQVIAHEGTMLLIR